jgi:hypothetical protein
VRLPWRAVVWWAWLLLATVVISMDWFAANSLRNEIGNATLNTIVAGTLGVFAWGAWALAKHLVRKGRLPVSLALFVSVGAVLGGALGAVAYMALRDDDPKATGQASPPPSSATSNPPVTPNPPTAVPRSETAPSAKNEHHIKQLTKQLEAGQRLRDAYAKSGDDALRQEIVRWWVTPVRNTVRAADVVQMAEYSRFDHQLPADDLDRALAEIGRRLAFVKSVIASLQGANQTTSQQPPPDAVKPPVEVKDPPLRVVFDSGALLVVNDRTDQRVVGHVRVDLYVEDILERSFRGSVIEGAPFYSAAGPFTEKKLTPLGSEGQIGPLNDLPFTFVETGPDSSHITVVGYKITRGGSWVVRVRCEWTNSRGQRFVSRFDNIEFLWEPGSMPVQR